MPPPLRSTLFPYTTLFRSLSGVGWLSSFCSGRSMPVETTHSMKPGVAPKVARGCSKTCKKRSEEHTSELQSLRHLVCRLLLEKKKNNKKNNNSIRKLRNIS